MSPGDHGRRGCYLEVLPNVSGIDRSFGYLWAEQNGEPPREGTIVRVPLHGRRVRGWVLEKRSDLPPDLELQEALGVVSVGPSPAVVELCRWGAWRFAGRLRPLLAAASPERIVRPDVPQLAGARSAPPGEPEGLSPALSRALDEALSAKDAVISVGPLADRLPFVLAALKRSFSETATSLVLVDSREEASRLSRRLSGFGWRASVYPESFGEEALGCVVVGTRNAVFAAERLSLVLVLDAESASYRSERTPNFDARLLGAERGRRDDAPVVFVTSTPPIALVTAQRRRLVGLSPTERRSGWGQLSVLDSREEDPAERGYPSLLVSWLKASLASQSEQTPALRRPVVCIVNRVGRARLLACSGCKSLQRCADCGAALVQLEKPPPGRLGELSCPRCARRYEALCSSCGSGRLNLARSGVQQAREQLEAVTGTAVSEMSGPRAPAVKEGLVMATQAALYRLRYAALVCWLEFDRELLAPRLGAGEDALGLLARSLRLTRAPARSLPDGRVVVRTALPDHEVLLAAIAGDPTIFTNAETARRKTLGLPPFSSIARLSGEGAEEAAARLGPPLSVTGGVDGYLVTAPDDESLSDGLGSLLEGEQAGWAGLGLRVELDPPDI